MAPSTNHLLNRQDRLAVQQVIQQGGMAVDGTKITDPGTELRGTIGTLVTLKKGGRCIEVEIQGSD
jgi:hypothetical protein